MATNKNKKEVKVRDLKPSKDAKGGGGRKATSTHAQSGAGGSARGFQSTSHGGTGKLN
jgi:hypothetical protein